jgi:undecaprenyl-diphosphatase
VQQLSGARTGRRISGIRVPLVVAVIALVLLAPLIGAADATTGMLHRFDHHSADALNRYAVGHPALVTFWRFVTDIGGPLTWRLAAVLVIAVIALWVRHRHADAILIVLTMVAAAIVSGAVKAAVARPRPSVPHPMLHVAGASFPSGHALTSAAAMGLVVVVACPRLRARGHLVGAVLVAIGAVVVALLIGVSRLVLGVHYVTDVVAGWLFGALIVAVMLVLVRTAVQLAARRGHAALSP